MLTNEEFRLFRNLVYDESGIYLAENKKDFLEHRLMGRMKATNKTTPYWYYRFLLENRKAELLLLLDYLTVNETQFFRNMPQFDLFRNVILPDITARKKKEGKRTLRIWSAGCSTGEEAYSIAMCVLDFVENITTWDIKVLASDLSLHALEVAHRCIYPEEKVRESVPPPVISKYFERQTEAYRVRELVRNLVVFDYHNLKHENGMSGLDVVFCRNVMIYFDEEEQKRLAKKFYISLSPGGYLLIGHAESLHGWNLDFQFIHDNKGTAYKKIDRGATL